MQEIAHAERLKFYAKKIFRKPRLCNKGVLKVNQVTI